MADDEWRKGAYLAEFGSADELSTAVRSLYQKGYTQLETFSPVPLVDGVRARRTRLPVAVFIAGLAGGVASYAIEWYANAYAYVQDLGGRPAHAVPAFLIPTFEGAVLAASLAAFIGFFVSTGLPRFWHPVFEIDGFGRATADRYWLAIDAGDRRSEHDLTIDELRACAPARVIWMEPEG
jgi:hypothetical protein